MATKEAGKALAQALAGNSVLKELNVASNIDGKSSSHTETDGPGFVKELAVGIKDMGAISSLNVLFNDIGTEQAQALAHVLEEHVTLKSLCGNTGNETELAMSGIWNKKLGAEGAIMLAPEIADNGAMSKLTFGDKQVVTMTSEMPEANFSGKLRSFDARIVAAFLPKCT
jgi:hypothetical protein